MNKELFDKLDRISDTIFDIDVKVKAINQRLDELIKALHDYDDDNLHCEYSGLPSVKAYDEPKQGPCSKHDEASWDEERMNIIGQNGNEGLHYESMEELNDEFFGKIIDDGFDDYGKRVVGDKDKSNNSDKHTVGEKKRNKRKYYKSKPKSAIVEHQKYPPHKH